MIGLNDGAAVPASLVRDRTEKLFSDGGWLCGAFGLEHRPEQERMAHAVAEAFLTNAPLLCEAGTGVGKSLAYLLPGIVFAVEQKRQLVVSTHTISLQEQILKKDLPMCRRLFETVQELAAFAEFRAALLVGKSNYLCTTRLAQALKDRSDLLGDAFQADLLRVSDWARRTGTGLRHELTPPPNEEVWELVNADSGVCSRKNCDPKHCFYQRARARVESANVLVVNHSLLFSLLRLSHLGGRDGVRGVLRPDDFVVLDEGHTVPEVATDHTGTNVSSFGLDRLLRSLFNPKRNKGFLSVHGGAEEKQATEDALEASAVFFEYLRERLLAERPIARVRSPGVAEPLLDKPLLALIARLSSRANRLRDGSPPRDDLLDRIERLQGYHSEIARWLGVAEMDHVYWAERTGRRQTTITLRAAPLDVAPYLRKNLVRRETGVVLTSATLTVGGAIEPFQRKAGADDVRTIVESSPFDFERNMRVYVAEDMSPPSARDAKLDLEGLVDYIRFCTLRVGGGSLVLFTSYSDMRYAADRLGGEYAEAGRPFLVQGRDGSRTELADRMRKAGNGILFGTDSFWTGVDVPGRSLMQVIITRLPFDPPTHPVAEARAEWIRARGGNPFAELTLPDALMKFRQGIGRLIRSRTDRGVITLLDSRILLKPYGRDFLASLPNRRFERINRDTREAVFIPSP